MDTILIKELQLFAYHGVNPEEKRDGQNFILDIELDCDLSTAKKSDRLEDTVNYAAVVKQVRTCFCENRFDLIEAAADFVLAGVMENFPAVQRAVLTLKKPEAPVKASFGYMAVRMERRRA